MNTTKISLLDFNQLPGRRSLKRKNVLAQEILGLQVGEGLVVLKSDWKFKTPPAQNLHGYVKKGDFDIKSKELLDGSGWALLRTK